MPPKGSRGSDFTKELKDSRLCNTNREIKDIKKFLADHGYKDFFSPNAYRMSVGSKTEKVYRGIKRKGI